jgi:predicted NAD/FAD-binding protein
MLAEVSHFHRAAVALLESGDEEISLHRWLRRERFSRTFVERLLVPQAAAVWSADPRQMWSFPALFLARFFDNHGMLSLRGRPRWRTVAGGSERYVQALAAGFRDRVRLASPVRAITRGPYGVTVQPEAADALSFDHVVIATHSDQALEMLADATWREHEVLGTIPYQENEAVLHTDASMLPRRRAAWASWNYHLLEQPTGRTTVTYHLNRLQALNTREQYCVTLNLGDRIAPERVISRIAYAHPVYTPAGVEAQRRVAEVSGLAGRTHFCGAYWGWGFHEDGVQSALRVAECFGAGL